MNIACIYVLAKNEISNIHACLDALAPLQLPVVVLDSGSSDGTIEATTRYPTVECRPYTYRGHCHAYNELTAKHTPAEIIVILDADMRINRALVTEINTAFTSRPALAVGIAPITMHWDGLPLRHSNLCPPKWIAFRGGQEYFQPIGHGETLYTHVTRTQFRTPVVHDDRKPFSQTLANQWRYAIELSQRAKSNQLTWRDKLRIHTPLMLLITPLTAFIAKLGFMDGKAGVIYALDRLIYEALAYRAAISPLVQKQLASNDNALTQADFLATADIKLPTENRVN